MLQSLPHHLSNLGFRRIVPTACLRPYIKWFWAIESGSRLQDRRSEFMHSHGSLSLLFNWGDDLELNHDHYSQSVFLEKVNTQSRQIVLTGRIDAFGVLFRAGGAYAIFGIPMQEVTSVDSLRNFDMSQLHEQLAVIHDFQEKVNRVESWFVNMLKQARGASRIVPATLQLIDSTEGFTSIRKIADEVGIGERQLERIFKKEVGFSPKKFTALVRVHRARDALKQIGSATLADIACQTGFYDQAHFCREFKRFVGVSPGDYVSRR